MSDTGSPRFPVRCVFCRKCFPAGDAANIMEGGGECRKWNSPRICGGRDCPDFEPLGEKCLFSGMYYRISAVPLRQGGFLFGLAEMNSDSFLVSCAGGTAAEAERDLGRRLQTLADAAGGCHGLLDDAVRNLRGRFSGMCHPPENDFLSSLGSSRRRRFNTFVSGHPRNLQLTFRFADDLSGDEFTVPMRIAGFGRNAVSMAMMDPDGDGYARVDSGLIRGCFLEYARDEFAEYEDFLRRMRDGMDGFVHKWMR